MSASSSALSNQEVLRPADDLTSTTNTHQDLAQLGFQSSNHEANFVLASKLMQAIESQNGWRMQTINHLMERRIHCLHRTLKVV